MVAGLGNRSKATYTEIKAYHDIVAVKVKDGKRLCTSILTLNCNVAAPNRECMTAHTLLSNVFGSGYCTRLSTRNLTA
jgi:hypothetical protein